MESRPNIAPITAPHERSLELEPKLILAQSPRPSPDPSGEASPPRQAAGVMTEESGTWFAIGTLNRIERNSPGTVPVPRTSLLHPNLGVSPRTSLPPPSGHVVIPAGQVVTPAGQVLAPAIPGVRRNREPSQCTKRWEPLPRKLLRSTSAVRLLECDVLASVAE